MKSLLSFLRPGAVEAEPVEVTQPFESVSDIADIAPEARIACLLDLEIIEQRLGIPGVLTTYLKVPDKVAAFVAAEIAVTICTTGHNIVFTVNGSVAALDQAGIDTLRATSAATA